ncbi:Nitrilase [Fusarium falciforme]|uniref:Nitrilase n=1 Tax=Fusarium falciforme TaxID=195108 RepID=UPI002300F0A2|nr:Nitrilase [Fusarium falciforme]WAO96105.1 Nitrilase [Fusarium falciforme]
MSSNRSTVKVAAIQAEPAWNDLQGGVAKVMSLIQEASSNSTNVTGFPEVFIPGYPWVLILSFIDETGTIVHHRRKIKPTRVERAFYGDGQGEPLNGRALQVRQN